MAVLLHAVPLAGVCRKERSSPVPQVRARPEEMRCVGSKRTPEVGRDMLLAASIVKFSGPKAPWGKSHCAGLKTRQNRHGYGTRGRLATPNPGQGAGDLGSVRAPRNA